MITNIIIWSLAFICGFFMGKVSRQPTHNHYDEYLKDLDKDNPRYKFDPHKNGNNNH